MVACHSGTALSTSGRISRSTIVADRLAGLQRPAQVGPGLLGHAERGRSPLPGSSMAAAA